MPPDWSSATCPICLAELGIDAGHGQRREPQHNDDNQNDIKVSGLACGHYFHEHCINGWIQQVEAQNASQPSNDEVDENGVPNSQQGQKSPSCPVCQTQIAHPIPEHWP